MIDGQQRLATLSVFALAVIDRLQTMAKEGIDPENNKDRANELHNYYIGKRDPASLVRSRRLHLNQVDDEFYKDNLVQLKFSGVRKLPKSSQLLRKCFLFFADELKTEKKLKSDDGEAVTRLLSETVAHQFQFIVITAADELGAYTVFETLNARGLDLTSADLLKNYLFSKMESDEELDYMQSHWKRITDTVGQERVKHFLRYHMLCKEFPVRERQLFKLTRGQARHKKEAKMLVDDLVNRAEPFAAFMDPNHDLWKGKMYKARPYIHELKLFRSRQPMPLLLAAWEHLREDFISILDLTSVISFRYTVICGYVANVLERAYHEAAKAVAGGKATNAREVFELLQQQQVYVSDEKMQHDFGLWDANNAKLSKYILVCLEKSRRGSDWFADESTIEHILPGIPREEWAETYDKDRWETDVGRLGNLTLLEMDENQKLSNKTYPEKLVVYRKSGYRVTKRVAKLAPRQWTPELLGQRQKEMAKEAVKIWKSKLLED